MITDSVKKQIPQAMKDKDEVRLSTLKLLYSSLHNARIEKMSDLTEEEELKVVRSEAKKRKDAIELYKQADAKEKIEREEKELEILKEFLPKELPDDEVEKIIDEVISSTGASGMTDMGKVMGVSQAKIRGRADGKKVADLVRKKLSA